MDPEVISVQLFGADVRFTFDDGTSLPVDSAVISRSSVLSDMVSSMDDGDGSELLHTPSGYLVAWLELASSDDQCTHSRSYERLLFSLQAADFFADERALTSLISALGQCIIACREESYQLQVPNPHMLPKQGTPSKPPSHRSPHTQHAERTQHSQPPRQGQRRGYGRGRGRGRDSGGFQGAGSGQRGAGSNGYKHQQHAYSVPVMSLFLACAPQVLLQLPFDLSVLVLQATHIPLENCLLELPEVLHAASLCAHFPSVTQSRTLKLLEPHSIQVMCAPKEKAVFSTAQPEPVVFAQLLRAVGMFRKLRELFIDMQQSSLRVANIFGYTLHRLRALTSLTLHGSFISDAVAKGTARALPRLRHLQTLRIAPGMSPYVIHPRVNEKLIRAIGRCRNILHLDLHSAYYRMYRTRQRSSWHHACAIDRLQKLETLRVYDGSAHSGYLIPLQRFIERPSGGRCSFTLKNLRELSIISLNGAQGAKPLAVVLTAFPALEKLQLRHSQLREDGAEALAPAFASLPLLKHLDLSYCVIDNTSRRTRSEWQDQYGHGNAQNIAQQMNNANAAIQNVDGQGNGAGNLGGAWGEDDGVNGVGGNGVANVGEQADVDGGHHGVALFYDGPLSAPGRALSVGLAHLKTLEELVLRDLEVGVDSALAVAGVVGMFRKLRRLDMHGWMLSDHANEVRGARALARSLQMHSNLEHLDLSSTAMTCVGLAVLMPAVAQHSNLISLDLSAGFSVILPEGFRSICQHLGSLSCLAKLRLQCTEASCMEVDRLASALQPLTCITNLELQLQNRAYVSVGSFRNLLESLRGLVKCEKLHLHAQMNSECVTGLVSALQCMPRMQELNLSWNEFGDTGATALAHAFESMHELTRVSLGYCELTGFGAEVVVASLEKHARMHECILSNNAVEMSSLAARARPSWVFYERCASF